MKQIESKSEPIAHTYHPTRWPFINHLLDIVDTITHGRAGQLQQFMTFAFLGGLAALVNVGVLHIIDAHTMATMNENTRYIIAFLIATEISIIVNFSLNDYFTFKHLPGYERPWITRCMRFHMTSISGTLLTFFISFSLIYKFNAIHEVAQAVAILLVLFYNFAAHHLFTYRRVKTALVN